jgi:carboxylesterase type B
MNNHHLMKNALRIIPDWKNFLDTNVSEDCLYLNIYAPISSQLQPNRTVMVWIHGGSFSSGSISIPFYDGSVLAANNDVIVVSINYRLGIFGFLYADETDMSGNYGLYDQVLALKWIKNNIKSFGGNPNNIVIFGESAGGISIGYHMISPLSEGLFSRAILQSGNAVLPMIIDGKETHKNATIDVVKGAKCPLPPISSDNLTQELNNESLSCLRQVNASILFELFEEVTSKRIGTFIPIDGNDFLPEHPHELVKKRKFNSIQEILIGSNAVEGNVIVTIFTQLNA